MVFTFPTLRIVKLSSNMKMGFWYEIAVPLVFFFVRSCNIAFFRETQIVRLIVWSQVLLACPVKLAEASIM